MSYLRPHILSSVFFLGFSLIVVTSCGPQQNSPVFHSGNYPSENLSKKDSSASDLPDPEAVEDQNADVKKVIVNPVVPLEAEDTETPPEIIAPPVIEPREIQCPSALPKPQKVSDLLGVNLDLHKPDGSPRPDTLIDLGIKWLRIEFKPFNRDFDKAINGYLGEDSSTGIAPLKQYKDVGLKIILIVDYMLYERSYWPDMNEETWNEYFTAYQKNLAKAVDKLNPYVDVWQIWNEPDHRVPGYEPYLEPSRYALLLTEFHHIIRPQSCSPIILGGLANGDGGSYIKKTIDAYKNLNAQFPFEAISIHPYGQGTDGLFENFGKLENLVGAYQHNAIDSSNLGDSLQIVITEAGLNASRDTNYKEYVIAMYQRSFELGIPFLTWFAWHDNMVESWGIFRRDGSHRPSYEAFMELKNL